MDSVNTKREDNMTRDAEIKARIPGTLKKAVATASAAQYQTESEFIRQAVIAKLRAIGKLSASEAIAA